MNRQIIFSAQGVNAKGAYDCSFSISFPTDEPSITQSQLQSVVDAAVQDFHIKHPTGKIVGQTERFIP